MNQLDQIKELIQGNQIKFESPIKVKATPHSNLVMIYEIFITDKGFVYLRLSDGIFHHLEAKDHNFEIVANSILQRLKILKLK